MAMSADLGKTLEKFVTKLVASGTLSFQKRGIA